MFGSVSLAALATIVGPALAQFANWQDGQVSTEICVWYQPRGEGKEAFSSIALLTPIAAIIRDKIYLDGGNVWWLPRMDDGTTRPPVDNGMFTPAHRRSKH